MTLTFIGLGNPGGEYEKTRHNAGFMVLAAAQKFFDLSEWSDKQKLLTSEGKMERAKVLLALPQTFMNKSGDVVRDLVKSAKDLEKLVVAHDDIDLPLGSFKISYNRGSGGHRGVDSIIKALKSTEFTRVRIGISPAGAKGKVKKPATPEAVLKFIIGEFKPAELTKLKATIKKVLPALACIATEGREKAMCLYN